MGPSAGTGKRTDDGRKDTKSTDDSWSGGSRTPPSGGKQSPLIRFDPIQIAGPNDSKPISVLLDESSLRGGPGNKGTKGKSNNSVDTLYSLFLNHLLRPREWNAQFDGNGYFAFRREHIIALAEEC